MRKIFRYECRRLLLNKFFAGLVLVLQMCISDRSTRVQVSLPKDAPPIDTVLATFCLLYTSRCV